jgi:misacylated tRNA(Ala) deacylase
VRYQYVPADEAAAEPGVIRNRSVAPPREANGLVRLVEIVGLDRQACGGTHLASTRRGRPVRILKIDNKGRHNRRVRIGLASDRMTDDPVPRAMPLRWRRTREPSNPT